MKDDRSEHLEEKSNDFSRDACSLSMRLRRTYLMNEYALFQG
jgi:hypothetical protein